MSQPVAQCTQFTAPAGKISVTPPSGFALSVFFILVATPTDPEPFDVFHYWIAVGDTNTVTTDYNGKAFVLRVDVPPQLIQEISTQFFGELLKKFKNPNLPPGTPIIRPS